MQTIRTDLESSDPELFETLESKLRNLIYEIIQPLEALKGEPGKRQQLASALKARNLSASANGEKLKESHWVEGDLTSLIKFLFDKEKTLNFLSVKFLRQRYFADPVGGALLQEAIDQGVLKLSKIENPLKPLVMTTICKLNRAHPKVKEVLGDE